MGKKGNSKNDIASEMFNGIAEWLEQAAICRSPHAMEAYKYAMDLYMKFLDKSQGVTKKSLAWEVFTRERIEKWMRWLMDRGNKPQTVNLRLSHIREFLSFMNGKPASTYGHLYHEAARIKRLKVHHAEVRGVTDKAVEVIIRAINTATDAGARDFTLFLFLTETGARLDEAISVMMKDIRSDAKGRLSVTVVGKGRYVRTLYLTPTLTSKLREYTTRFHDTSPDTEAYLFFSKIKGKHTKIIAKAIQKRLKVLAFKVHKQCEEVTLDLYPHNYWHAYSTRRIKQGKQLAVVQSEMGHKSIQSTMTYIDTSSMIEQAQEAVENEEVKKIELIWNEGDNLLDIYRSKFKT